MTKPIITLLINFLRFRSIPWLSSKLSSLKSFAFSDIGKNINGAEAPRALLIFPTNSLAYYVRNQYQKGMQKKMHNIYFQGLAMVDCLVKNGYVVDCLDTDAVEPGMDTSKYALIIDESHSLPFLKKIKGQKRVFFCTGLKWDRWNANELERIKWFHDKYKVFIRPVRQIAPNFTDEVADYILFKGEHDQVMDMNQKAQHFQLSMPVDFEPENIDKDYSKRDFIWVGGYGALHKGLDIVVDAFEKMPDLNLHLFGSMGKEPEVMKWLQKKLKVNPNIKFHGFADFDSATFRNVISNCVAHVYPSAGENGCATLAQTAHFGVLPITTRTANNQSWCFGFTINGQNREEMITNIILKVKKAAALDNEMVKMKSLAIIDFAKRTFTRNAFINSFNSFLSEVKNDTSLKASGENENNSRFYKVFDVSKTA